MDRRSTLSTLMGRKPKKSQPNLTSPINNKSLTAYSGDWNFDQANHLLRRTMFGPKKEEIEQAVELGLSGTIELLFQEREMPSPPLNFNSDIDPEVPIGETWVNAIYTRGDTMNMIRGYRDRSLRAWTIGTLINSEMSIREKMTLFWHNHFVVQFSIVRDPIFIYNYISLLRENALGNFKDLVKKVTIDPAMLRYLNGRQNTKNNPNENYARELLELFTIGKGELAGPGDYSTFTEDDVIECAKILTGWRDFGYLTANAENPSNSAYIRNRHDLGSKQLSHRFNNAILENADGEEYAQLIDLVFQQTEVARFISRKLYRWFVFSVIDDKVEQNIIEPMAQLLIDNNFEINPVLQTLLSSEHFFEANLTGPMIKNPLDFVIGIFRQFEIKIDEELRRKYSAWNAINRAFENLQMVYFEPPDVAGWKAFYQAPGFYRIWISSATLGPRMTQTTTLATQGAKVAGRDIIIDVLAFADKIENSTDPNLLIDEFVKVLFPQSISQNQKDALKEALIPGLPDFEWTVEYGDYLANPEDEDLKSGAENRLRALIQAMLIMPEYYLS